MQTSPANLKLNYLWQTLTLDQHQRKFSLALRVVWTFSRSDFPFRVNIICDILFLSQWLFCGHSPWNGSLLFAESWLDAKAWRDCEMPSSLAGPRPSLEDTGCLCLRHIAEDLCPEASESITEEYDCCLYPNGWFCHFFVWFFHLLDPRTFLLSWLLSPCSFSSPAAASKITTINSSSTERLFDRKFVPAVYFQCRTTTWDYKVRGKQRRRGLGYGSSGFGIDGWVTCCWELS